MRLTTSVGHHTISCARCALPILALFIVLLVLAPAVASAYVTERVVLVIIDGLRYSEGLGDPDHEFVPRMAALAEQGAIVDDFRNDGITYTNRAIPAIWCGAWTEIYTFNDPACGGDINNYTELPTVFEYYRKQLSRPATDCVYVLKALCPWKASFDPDYGPDYWPLYHSEGWSDLDVWQEAEQVITDLSPGFLLVYLSGVDHAGHSGIWNDYTQAIVTADNIVGLLWDRLQADSAYAGRTTMLVTNDHGRHDWDFSGHGDGCDGCRHIQLLAVGPDVSVGLVSDTPRTLRDVAPTMGELLGFTTEAATGSAMTELLDANVAVEPVPMSPGPSLVVSPNPTNPATTVFLTLPSAGNVDLGLYDLTGHHVRTLVRGGADAGTLRIGWNGTDDGGRELPSGVYLLRLETDAGVEARKVTLVR